ncbi:MAG TPA: DUF3515 family protein [Mycobacteriales bacterium]|nr:DUF3515 family protein [Mycobacteriales bacterium]
MAVAIVAATAAACSWSSVSVTPPHPNVLVASRCEGLAAVLPDTLAGLKRRPTTPKSPLIHAWGSPAVTLACGVPAPAGYHAASTPTLSVDNVQWYEQVGKAAVTWTAIRPTPLSAHRIYVALAVPKSYQQGASFLTALTTPLKAALR